MTNKEAIKDIQENIKPFVGGKSLDMAIEALKNEPRWIPVTEKLPKYKERVLVQLKNDTMIDGSLTLVDGKYPMWYIKEYPTYLMRSEVLAWIPLPEPYREVEE